MPRLSRFEPLEPRSLLSSVQFGLVDGRPVSARLAPEPGGRVVVTLRGPGTGSATVRDGRIDLLLENTAAGTTVSLKSAGRSPVRLGDVVVPGPLGTLRAPTADAAGVFTFAGPVGSVELRSAPGLTIRAASTDLGALRVGSGRAARGAPAEFTGAIEARRLGTMSVAGNASFDARVQFAEGIAVSGDLGRSTITVMPVAEGEDAALGRLAVGGTMRAVKIVAMGAVGAVRAGAMVDSDVMAGVRYDARSDGTFEHVLPAESYTRDFDFTGQYRVGSVAVTGLRTARRPRHIRFVADGPMGSAPSYFSNSRVAAYDVGDVLLEGVRGGNGGRPFGVAAYRIGSVVRRWADPYTTADFAVRQTLEPLAYREGPDGYGGYYGSGYGAIGVVDGMIGGIVLRGGGVPELPYIDIPETGARLGSATVNGLSPTLYLMRDGSYELRVGAEAPIARDATLAALIRDVAGTAGTSMKVVHRPGTSMADGSAQFLSTSVSGTVTLTLPAAPKPFRSAVTGPTTFVNGPEGMPVAVPGVTSETFYTVPTLDELRAALQSGGTEVRVFDRDLLLVKPEGREVGRAFDDTGLRKVLLTAQNTFRLTDAAGAVLWEGADLSTALMGTGPRLGVRRMPVRLVGKSHVFVHGLARGGTAVFNVGGQTTLDPVGNVNTLLDGAGIAERLRQAGVEFTGHGL